MLDSHPDLAVGPELHFRGPENLGPSILACLQRLEQVPHERWAAVKKAAPGLRVAVNFVSRCHRFGVGPRELRELIEATMAETASSLQAFEDRCRLIERIAGRVRGRQGASRWGIKIMRDLRILDRYAALWPEAQFVHIVRDGRDVAASQMRDHGSWGYRGIEEAARGWVDLIERTRRFADRYPVLELRYEDLVRHPETTMRRVLVFLGASWSPLVLEHTRVRHGLFENPHDHPSIESVTRPLNTAAIGRYRRDLDIEQIGAFQRIAGRQLEELGYESCHVA
jgi:hypothetical protein